MHGCRICDFDLCEECLTSHEDCDLAPIQSFCSTQQGSKSLHQNILAMRAEVARLRQENDRLQSAHKEVLEANVHLRRSLEEQESRLAWSKFDVLEEHYRGLEEHRQGLWGCEADQAAGSPAKKDASSPKKLRQLIAYDNSVPDQAAGSPAKKDASSPKMLPQLIAHDDSVPYVDLCTPRVDVIFASH